MCEHAYTAAAARLPICVFVCASESGESRLSHVDRGTVSSCVPWPSRALSASTSRAESSLSSPRSAAPPKSYSRRISVACLGGSSIEHKGQQHQRKAIAAPA
eukprot:6192146-Pleurochrysis_carterae.AAC.2